MGGLIPKIDLMDACSNQPCGKAPVGQCWRRSLARWLQPPGDSPVAIRMRGAPPAVSANTKISQPHRDGKIPVRKGRVPVFRIPAARVGFVLALRAVYTSGADGELLDGRAPPRHANTGRAGDPGAPPRHANTGRAGDPGAGRRYGVSARIRRLPRAMPGSRSEPAHAIAAAVSSERF